MPIKIIVLLWVTDIDTTSQHCKSLSMGFQGPHVPVSINTSRHAAYNRNSCMSQSFCQLPCDLTSIGTSAPRADNRHTFCLRIRQFPHVIECVGRVVNTLQFLRIYSILQRHKMNPLLLKLHPFPLRIPVLSTFNDSAYIRFLKPRNFRDCFIAHGIQFFCHRTDLPDQPYLELRNSGDIG